MKNPKKRTRKTRTGSSRRLILLLFVLSLISPAAFSAKKDKPNPAAAPFALIAGTVYRPPGFALPGVAIAIAPDQPEANGVKLKKADAVTNSRGEWAIRVPPVPAKWRVDVKMNGYRPEQRVVSVEGEQRLDVSIVMEPSRPPKEAQ